MKLGDLKENIHQETDDPSDPQVNIHGGGGVMLLSQVERNIDEKIKDIAKTVAMAKDADDWRRVKSKMRHDWMHAAVDTIIAAKDELEGNDEAQ
jgi:acyl-CoA reductase-like NAD-dependent aldehyde dehydrogenase